MHDIARFLAEHPPFDTLDEETLERVAASAEIEFYAPGSAILDDGLAEGEMFAFASLLQTRRSASWRGRPAGGGSRR
jgi:signal-transduction protein with cAMP-binding, CBS, and nucleotidyltransferase domain